MSVKLTKKDIISKIRLSTGCDEGDIGVILDSFFDITSDEIASGNKVDFLGFGSFFPTERKERIGRNPSTGEEIVIPAKTVPTFKASKKLKDKVDEGK